MSANGLVSAILPTYNRSGWLKHRIKDLLFQTHSNWELIIINDGSTDNTQKVIEPYLSDRIRLINLPYNSGSVCIPRAVGICASRGEFIAPLDDDVGNEQSKFECLVGALRTNDKAVLAYGDRIDCDLNTQKESPPIKNSEWGKTHPCPCGIDNGQFIYRARVFEEVPITFHKRACDWELAKQIRPLGDFEYVDSVVSIYYWHKNNRSLDESTKTKEIFPQRFKKFYDNQRGFKVKY